MNCLNKFFILLCLFCYNSSTGNAQTWDTLGVQGFTDGRSDNTAIAVDSVGTPYVVFVDSALGSKATVMKYDGSAWSIVGSAGFSAGAVAFINIAVDRGGTPYVVYQDVANAQKVTVMKYDGSSWVLVGTAGLSAGEAHFPSIAINGSGTPYVAYQDFANGQKATVMKFNGSTWVAVGSVGFSAGSAAYTNIAIDWVGAPYVVYQDYVNGQKATVMKYNGSGWVTFGSAGFSASTAYSTSIAVDSSGTPFVVYGDYATTISGQATAKKYGGSSWVNAGTPGFSAGESYMSSIAVGPGCKTPYVVYQDWSISAKAAVMKYNGTSWVASGSSSGLSPGEADYTSIAVDRRGAVYIVYEDMAHGKKATVMKLDIDHITAIKDTMCVHDTITLSDATTGGTWSSNNTAIATVNATGKVTGVAPGTAVISYTVSNISSVHVVTVNSCGSSTAVRTTVAYTTPYLAIHPNPSHGSFILDIKSADKTNVSITICDIMGRKVKEFSTATDTDVNVQLNEPAGVYFVTAILTNGMQLRTKIALE